MTDKSEQTPKDSANVERTTIVIADDEPITLWSERTARSPWLRCRRTCSGMASTL